MAGHSPEPPLHIHLFSFSFFLKPLSVALPFAARFAESEDSAPRAKANQMLGGSGKRDSGVGEGATLARFSLPPQISARCRTGERRMVG